jgi:putative spermidine/putrescine transport system ATP-binding protein
LNPALGTGRPSNTGTDVAAGGSRSEAQLEVVKLVKSFGGPAVVKEVSFALAAGKFLTLLGPSGSGKSTTLMVIGGFERPDSGDVRLDGRSIVGIPPQSRNLGIVFQSYALFPHMSVVDNVEFALRMRRQPKAERRKRALQMLERVGLRQFADRRPRQLSGGQQQRVALARALVFDPAVLLLDEPLGALDRRLRERLQLEIKQIHQSLGVSVVYVTHDQDEAMMMSDSIAVMRDGRVVQMGSPSDVYNHPVTPFVATFLGETNLLDCVQRSVNGAFAEVTLPDGGRGVVRRCRGELGGARPLLSVRPERLRLLSDDELQDNVIEGTLSSYTFLGATRRYTVDALGKKVVINRPDDERPTDVRPGERVRVGWSRDDAQLLPSAGDTVVP